MKVEDPSNYKRLGGSIIGETTLVTLVKLLSKHKSIAEACESACKGDNRKVDMTVGDIYGDSMKGVLKSDIIACSLGKRPLVFNEDNNGKNENVLRSLFIMMAINIAQLTGLHCQIEKLQRVVMVTSLLKDEVFFSLIQV